MHDRRVRIIGLTGGIATGKSTVAALLAGLGAVVVDSDRVAREVVAPGTPGLAAIAESFGPGFLNAAGSLDRDRLSAAVFADPGRRRRLEEITHPLIRARTAELVAAAAETLPPLVAVDIPLLFETGHREDFPDGVMLVYAEPALQIRRLMEREKLDAEAAAQRLAAQWPIADKRPLATWVIDNSGDLEATAAQVRSWWRRLEHGMKLQRR